MNCKEKKKLCCRCAGKTAKEKKAEEKKAENAESEEKKELTPEEEEQVAGGFPDIIRVESYDYDDSVKGNI